MLSELPRFSLTAFGGAGLYLREAILQFIVQREKARLLLPSSGQSEVLQVTSLPEAPGFRLGGTCMYVGEVGSVIAGGRYQKGSREERI